MFRITKCFAIPLCQQGDTSAAFACGPVAGMFVVVAPTTHHPCPAGGQGLTHQTGAATR